ncbi:MAG TPA: methylmalonyl Co-A mutase-associated GTPase MeaB [Beijerinckiaceae bacterium]|nr:methylmalonyl Co-A mutase-associated GTPase MeaB [Beijerinckiaceae bacterium]
MRTSPAPGPVDDLANRLRAGDRAALARAITLVESKRLDHQAQARALVQRLLPFTGKAVRLGITGVPGVGKSTTIDVLGMRLISEGHKVAVLAVDPTSSRTGGAILGDKTRMARLSMHESAFIRPSPAGQTLGGVAARTREAMLLCEAAGFDVVLVETVGIGQSETAVADMTDFFLVLLLPGGGDELQGIKKGVIELADMIAINKADGESLGRARSTAMEYSAALNLLTPDSARWKPPVILISGLNDEGLDGLWSNVSQHRALLGASGDLAAKRARQQVKWMWTMLDDRFRSRLRADATLRARLPEIEEAVFTGALSATLGADEIAAMVGL